MFSPRLAPEVFFRNFPFIKKSVIVQENDFGGALKALNRILRLDKVTNTTKFQETYEKPTRWRRRFMYERCKRIYDAEMNRKIQFISHTHRIDPWPR